MTDATSGLSATESDTSGLSATESDTSGLTMTGGEASTGGESTGMTSTTDDPPEPSSCAVSVGIVGEAFETQLAEPAGTPPFTWEALDPPGLAPGLSLDPNSGLLSGVPTAAGEFPLDIAIVDAEAVHFAQECTLEVLPSLGVDSDKLLQVYPSGCIGAGVILQELLDDGVLVEGSGEPISCGFMTGLGNGELPEGISINPDDCSIEGIVDPSEEYGMHAWITTFAQGNARAYVPYCAAQMSEGPYAISRADDGVDATFQPGKTKMVDENTVSWGMEGAPQINVEESCGAPSCFYKFYFDFDSLSGATSLTSGPSGKLGPDMGFDGFFHGLAFTDPGVPPTLAKRPWVVDFNFLYCISDVESGCSAKADALATGSNYALSVIVRP